MAPDVVDRTKGQDPKGAPRLSGEVQFVLIITAMLLVLVFAGLPIGPVREAGDGSWKLRHGWAARQRALQELAAHPATPAQQARPAQARQPAPETAPAPR